MSDGNSSTDSTDASGSTQHPDPVLEPSGIGQFVAHDRCPRYIKQRIDPGTEVDDRDWKEAFGLMNVGLLGHGQEFEARQVEAMADSASKIIGPALGDTGRDGVPGIDVDETWRDSARGRAQQVRAAVAAAAAELSTSGADTPYILLYQAPLGGELGAETVWGEADVIVLAPTTGTQASVDSGRAETRQSDEQEDVVARVIEVKSGREDQAAYRVQTAVYSALLEGLLGEEPGPAVRIETSVLTQASAAEPGATMHPLDQPTFRRAEWELIASRLLADGGPISEALEDDLEDLPYALDQVCNNCAYREACATRAVENPQSPASLALLGLDASIQATLVEAGIDSLQQLSTLLPRPGNPHPTKDPPPLDMDPETRRILEEAVSDPVHEVVLRAQALRSEIDPTYSSKDLPPAISGNDYVPMPADYLDGWSNIEGANSGELVHVALYVRPDSTINRVAVLGAAVYADAHGDYHTFSETIAALPEESAVATDLEGDMLERFTTQVFDAIETVARDLGTPEETVVHLYTYTERETEAFVEALDRHEDDVREASALRSLISLHPDGHTPTDQDMLSTVQSILNERFALQYPNQGLVTVADEFISDMSMDIVDPLDARPGDPPLRTMFRTQFFDKMVPYLADGDSIRLHLARGRLAEGPAAAAVTDEGEDPTLAGFYPLRKRTGGQFPLEYLWVALPQKTGSSTPRLHPGRVEEWAVDDEHRPLYREEIRQFFYRTRDHEDRIIRADIEYLAERLAYTLVRLVEAVPSKNVFQSKTPLDATALADFDLGVSGVPGAARDYLRMEHGANRETTEQLYRLPLRERARSGRSITVRCTAVDERDDGGISITGELAYDDLFADTTTARRVASQARIRDGQGAAGGSWRVITRLEGHSTPASSEAASDSGAGSSPRGSAYTEATVDDPTEIQHSPPVLVESLDGDAGTITLSTFPHRFQRFGSEFRVDHCGWDSPEGSNLDTPAEPPTERSGYVANRPPVAIEPGELYILDPMIDNFGAPKADRALTPDVIAHNTLWQQLATTMQTGRQPAAGGAPRDGVDEFLNQLEESDACLSPNDEQAAFVRAVDRAIVPLQGPPGTGKTSGAIAPALLARAYARARDDRSFVAVVVAPAHEAVDTALEHTVGLLSDYRSTHDELDDLRLLRVLPTTAPADSDRPDANTNDVSVSYANYHASDGVSTLQGLADVVRDGLRAPEDNPTQWLVFATPTTLYQTMGVIAEHSSLIDGTSPPDAMRHDGGLADVLCIDEASMLDLPQFLLAGSVLTPTGQTLLGGDDRQLATISAVEWVQTRRKPIETTQAHLSALEYIRHLNDAVTQGTGEETTDGGDSDDAQTRLTGFGAPGTGPADSGGDGDD